MSNSQDLDDEQAYPYELVSFPGYEDPNGRFLVDVVLGSWISFKRNKLIHVTKYPPPPYDRSTRMELNKLLKNLENAPDYWSEYQIDFKGRAKTLEEAQIRLKKLTYTEYAYTTESDHKGADKAEIARQKYRTPKLKVNPEEENSVFKVSKPFEYVEVGHGEYSASDESNSANNDFSSNNKKESKNSRASRGNSGRSVSSEDSYLSLSPQKEKLKKKRKSLRISQATPIKETELSPNVRKKFLPGGEIEPNPKKYKPSELDELSPLSDKSLRENKILQSSKARKNLLLSGNMSESKPKPYKPSKPAESKTPGFEKSLSHQRTNLKKVESRPTNSAKPSRELLSLFQDQNQTREDANSIFGGAVTADDLANPSLLFVKIMKALHIIYLDNKETQRKLRDIEAMLVAGGVNIDLPRSFAEKYELSLPISELKDFEAFENKLKSDSAFRYEFKQTFNDLMDRNGALSRTLGNILKTYLARELVILFNAVKRTENKSLIFKETEFYKCMLDIITKRKKLENKILTEKEFLKVLGPVITNSIDWDGHRALRGKKVNLNDLTVVFSENLSSATTENIEKMSHDENNE